MMEKASRTSNTEVKKKHKYASYDGTPYPQQPHNNEAPHIASQRTPSPPSDGVSGSEDHTMIEEPSEFQEQFDALTGNMSADDVEAPSEAAGSCTVISGEVGTLEQIAPPSMNTLKWWRTFTTIWSSETLFAKGRGCEESYKSN
jgi:hypothetical protein